MYDLDRLKERILEGTSFDSIRKNAKLFKLLASVNMSFSSLQYNSYTLRHNLRKLSMKELAFLRMMDEGELQPYYVTEIKARRKFESYISKIIDVAIAIADFKHDEYTNELSVVAMEHGVSERFVGLLNEVKHERERSKAAVDKSYVMEKLRKAFDKDDYTLFDFLGVVRKVCGVATLLEVNETYMNQVYSHPSEKLSPELVMEIKRFVSINDNLRKDELSYLLSSIYQLREEDIVNFVED